MIVILFIVERMQLVYNIGDNVTSTTQLIKKADGQKFGKTESGAVWLDPKKTSPYKYYQFWLNTSDDDAKNWIRIFTLKTEAEIKETSKQVEQLEKEIKLLQGVRAATESTTITSTAPERTSMSVISRACSPVSGWDTSKSSTLTPSLPA